MCSAAGGLKTAGELWSRHYFSVQLPGPAVSLMKHLLSHPMLPQHHQISTKDFLCGYLDHCGHEGNEVNTGFQAADF